MIDTVVLTLNKENFVIVEPEKFTPSAQWIFNSALSYHVIQSKQNPTKKELLCGIYKPRLTLSHRSNTGTVLRIELSLPKLLFGNNFIELQHKDFCLLIQRFIVVLQEMGVAVTQEALELAPVSAIHYAKNIVLTDGARPYHYIQKIKEANLRLSLDTNQTDYRNEGHSYKWHTNSYEVAFYDKIKDLEKARLSEKRSIEKDNAIQFSLLSNLKRRKMFEMLRMEVRLNTRRKINQLFSKIDIKTALTFKKLFKPAISRKILLYYLNEISSMRPLFLDYKASDKALLFDLIFNNIQLGLKQVLQFYGMKHALNVVTPRELRAMFGRYNQRSWHRLMADVKKISLPITQDPLDVLRKQLEKFKAITQFPSWQKEK